MIKYYFESLNKTPEQILSLLKSNSIDATIECANECYEFCKKVIAIEEKELIPEISVDMDIELSDVNDKLLRILSQFQPFGPDNAEPVFSSNQIYDANKVRNVGKNHLKFAAITIKENIVPISCIGFSLGAYYDLLKYGRMIDICYTIEENTYQGNSELQLNVKDIRESKENSY